MVQLHVNVKSRDTAIGMKDNDRRDNDWRERWQ